MRRFRFAVMVLVLASATGLIVAQAAAQDDKGIFTSSSSGKFAALPGAPACMTARVDKGDPSKGAAVIALKFTAGCKVPWHWHTSAENLFMVSGSGKAAMKDGGTAAMHAGSFAYLPAKHVHEFTCVAACMMYDMTETAFDLHYVDADGKEISPEQALAKPKKAMAAAKSMKRADAK